MLAVSLMGSAQMVSKKMFAAPSKGKAATTVVTPLKADNALRPEKADAAWKSQLVNQAPLRSKANGVFYNRPSGSYLCGYTRDWGGWSADFIFGVPLGDNEFENACDNPMEATWSLVTSSAVYDLEGEEETNNLILSGYSYNGDNDTNDNGFSLFYLPTINVGRDSYTWGESNENGGAFAIAGRPSPLTKAIINKTYSGWTDGGYIFGTNAEDINFDFDGDGTPEHYRHHGIWQVHEAPQSPLYVEDIFFLGRLGYSDEDPDTDIPATIPEGTEVHLLVTNVDEEGFPGDEIIADLTCTADDIMPIEYQGEVVAYSFVFAKKEIDILGTESVVPFTIDKEYAIILNWNVEGVDLNISGNDFEREDEDVYSRQPSYMILTDDEGNTSLTTLSYNGVTVTPVFEAMFDYVTVHSVLYGNDGTEYTDMNLLTAPVEGGKLWEISDENVNTFAYCETALPWFDETEAENYYFDELPDWIVDYAVEVDTEGENASGFTFVSFEVEPLPAGVEGRRAKLYIHGRGFVSENPIILVQGVDPGDEQQPQPEELDLTINHERQTGLGYTADQVAVDLTEAAAYLGVDAITTDMLRIENPDGTLISDYAPFDGWFDGDGVATAWGDNTKICVKFFQALEGGQFDVCDMNGADEDGKTYTVKWQLVNGEKTVRYTINVTFKKPEVKELEIVDKGIATSVTYDVTEGDYVMKTATITDEQVAAICQELGIEALTNATIFGFNPTTKELVKNHTGYDGWRDANGDFHNWNADGTQAPACVKINDNGTTDGGQTYYCYNRSGQEPQTIKCYWALANEEKAVLVEIDFVYFSVNVNPDAPELTAPEGWTSVISNGNLAGDDVKSYIAKEYPSTEPVGATIVPGAGMNGSRGIVVKSQDKVSQAWDSQFWIQFAEKLPDGTKLHVEFDYKADLAGTVGTQAHGLPGNYQHFAAIGNVDFDTEWKHFSADVDVIGDMVTGNGGDGMLSIAFNLNDIAEANNFYFDNFGVWMQKPAPVDDWTNILRNSDLEGTQVDNFFSKEAPSTAVVPSTIFDGAGVDGSRGIKVVSAPAATNDWDTQFWIYLPTTLPEGTKYKVEFDYKADRNASADTQAHGEPGNYIHFSMIGSPSFTTEWQHYVKEGSISADQAEGKTDGVPNGNKMRSIAFNLSKDKDNEVTYFFDNIKFFVEKAFAETGIVNVNSNNTVEGAIYNLRGQQVKNAQKGIFIQNGKKIVVK